MDAVVADTRVKLRANDLHASLQDPALRSMNFLNEVSARFPNAISFAAGRPTEDFFAVESIHRHLDRFCRHLREDLGRTPPEVNRTLFQYGRTKGIVHELIARNLAVDENIIVDPEAVIVTVGCQEALYLCLRALRVDERDAVLAVSPTYVGLVGAARLAEMTVLPVAEGPGGIDFADLETVLGRARRDGVRARACYLVPDYANPSGASMSVTDRRRLLGIAAEQNMLLLEDNPYGLFADGAVRPPTLKALDSENRVVYLGSLAKTGMPGVRIGYAVADQTVVAENGALGLFADELSKLKSMLTVNTSPIAQAVAGGKLLEYDCSLVRANARETMTYRANRRLLTNGLARRFQRDAAVRWNSPDGGFFVVMTVPFVVDDELLEHSARVYRVLWTPMSHFYQGSGGENQMRLSCSAVTPAEIEEGLDRFHSLVVERRAVAGGKRPTTSARRTR